jgi:hypothetical protein
MYAHTPRNFLYDQGGLNECGAIEKLEAEIDLTYRSIALHSLGQVP